MHLADKDFACTYYASFHVLKDATVELEGTECAMAPLGHAKMWNVQLCTNTTHVVGVLESLSFDDLSGTPTFTQDQLL